jgi:predicted Mrr-cat superfamily restriction endonuclease
MRVWRLGATYQAPYRNIWRDVMLAYSCIAVGYSRLGPLRAEESSDAIADRIRNRFPHLAAPAHLANVRREARSLELFRREIQPDDLAIVTHGRSVRGLGRVLGQYEYHHEDRELAANRRPANWVAEFRGQAWVLSKGDLSLVDEITDRNDLNAIRRRFEEYQS